MTLVAWAPLGSKHRFWIKWLLMIHRKLSLLASCSSQVNNAPLHVLSAKTVKMCFSLGRPFCIFINLPFNPCWPLLPMPTHSSGKSQTVAKSVGPCMPRGWGDKLWAMCEVAFFFFFLPLLLFPLPDMIASLLSQTPMLCSLEKGTLPLCAWMPSSVKSSYLLGMLWGFVR